MVITTIPDFLRYWGKAAKSDGHTNDTYHLLPYHCLDVAACGYYIVKKNIFNIKYLLNKCNISDQNAANWIAWLFACHDIGKFARGFQEKLSFSDPALVPPIRGIAASERHDSLGFYLWEQLLGKWCHGNNEIIANIAHENREKFKTALNIWMSVSTGHHGVPPNGTKNAMAFHDDDTTAACHYLETLNQLFPFKLPKEWATKIGKQQLRNNSWFFAGVMTIADWMGSDQIQFPFFSSPIPLKDYWSIACKNAKRAILNMPLLSKHSPYTGHQALFPFINTLTPLQQRVTTLNVTASGPQLIILEDVTGAGKTEAALILTHRLMSANKGKGLYVGLPTMATANAMYARLAQAYRALFADNARPSLILAHGARQLSSLFTGSIWQPDVDATDDHICDDNNTSAECHSWFADSRKKSLLAEVGVGTLDQLLMAVMPFRHQSLRLLGMHNKILLLDEVHAYDGYMMKLLEGLLRFHAAQGGSVIILSATLPISLREKLLNAFADGAEFATKELCYEAGYPWLTHLSSGGLLEEPLAAHSETQRTVTIHWLHTRKNALDIIYQAVNSGQCICWIRNTIDSALDVFQQLLHDGKIPEHDLLLFHSRFAFTDRITIEEKTLSWFGKNASVNERRGKVLIATQVVEQSLDLDFDCMISDLAPIDLLIQRTGRLQRHIRDAHGKYKTTLPDERQPPILHILAPTWQPQAKQDWLGQELRSTGYVYPDHACLWRTQALLKETGEIRMPENARMLVDGVYEQKINAPSELQVISNDAFGQILGQRSVAEQNLLQRDIGYKQKAGSAWDKAKEFSTRLSEESLDIYLAWLDENNNLHPIAIESDFPWEMSRLSVRLSWWQKHSTNLLCPNDQILEQFRKKLHRPDIQVILVSPQGEASYYSKRFGLIINDEME